TFEGQLVHLGLVLVGRHCDGSVEEEALDCLQTVSPAISSPPAVFRFFSSASRLRHTLLSPTSPRQVPCNPGPPDARMPAVCQMADRCSEMPRCAAHSPCRPL